MLGAGLCSFCTQCQLRAGKRARVLVEEDGGAARAKTLWKNYTGGGRGHETSCEGTVLKKGGCQSGLSSLPHPILCAKFQERLSPRSHVGGD